MEVYGLKSLLALAILSTLISGTQTQTVDSRLSTDCHYEIIEGKSPVISTAADSTWQTYRPEVEVDSDEDDTELCQERCCEDSDCELVAITRNEVSNITECVLFKCEEGGCSLKNNARYTVHLKSKRASQISSTAATPHEDGIDTLVTEEIIGHLTATAPEQPELQDEVTTPASEPTTTTTETDIAIKTGYIPTETGNIPPETASLPPETSIIPPGKGILPSETGSTPPERGSKLLETGNIPNKTLPLINDKISSQDYRTGSKSSVSTAIPPTNVIDKTLTPEPADDEITTVTSLPNHIDNIITTTNLPIESSHITILSVTHITIKHPDNSSETIITVTKNPPLSTSDPITSVQPITAESITTAKLPKQGIGLSKNLQNANRTDPPTAYNNDTFAEVKPYIWQVPWWYDGTVNQQHVTLFAMLLIGISMALIVGFCIARICVRSWRVKRRTRKGYLYLSRFM